MRLFSCPSCGLTSYFENRECSRCGKRLGYDAGADRMRALVPADGLWYDSESGEAFRFCENAAHDACNWLIPAGSAARFCLACQHNRTVPDLSDQENLARWRVLETAKHRLIYTFLKLRLPRERLAFDFLADPPDGPRVMTGHNNGLVTIALREADDVERERMRVEMGEYYRTVLGHFRHETGHYIWQMLVAEGGELEACRAHFGDDRMDYAAAIDRHYENGPPEGWEAHYVSAYATMHPWEDFAETWAHYLHMIDTLEAGASYGLRIAPKVVEPAPLTAALDFDPFDVVPFQPLFDAWLPMASLLNSLNRSLGMRDVYPFVLTPAILRKMAFIHDLVRRHRLTDGPAG